MIRRAWLDWSSPCLPAAAAWLGHRDDAGADARTRPCDLRRVLCVTPGRRDGRLLLHLLASHCRDRGRALVPPAIVTPGQMVDRLLGLPACNAAAPELILAWVAAIEASDEAALRPLLPAATSRPDLVDRHELAMTLAGLRDELAGAGLDFADLPRVLHERRAPASEAVRWEALAGLEARARAVLDSAGRVDPHAEQRRALGAGARTGSFDEVVLVATRELNRLQRNVLDAVDGPVTALIHAPKSMESRFDEHGCLVIDAWLDDAIDIADEQIAVCDQPADQSQAAISAIASFDRRYAAAQITLGFGDEALSGQVERDATAAGLSVHPAWGRPMSGTPPYRLLLAVADWLEEPRFAHLSSLLRHADVDRWLAARGVLAGVAPWLTLLDRYFTDHLHERPSGAWLGDPKTARELDGVYRAVRTLLQPLDGPSRPFGDWAEAVLGILREVYGDVEPAPGAASVSLEACLALRDVVASLANLPEVLQPSATVAEALRIMLAAAEDLPVATDARADQVEMLGWLELHLDPAPALVVTGVNDGNIPATVAGDAFLPDGLRRELGLACNDGRAARDAYLLQAILHSRETVTLITGRRGLDDSPLTPSRLLLSSDGPVIARRLRRFCRDETKRLAPLPAGLRPPGAASGFVVPDLPDDLPRPEVMHVTDFARYLECPYRYALARLLKLQAITDRAVELDPLRFGSLAHGVLDDFGRDRAARDSVDPKRIERFLLDALDRRVRASFGDEPLPAVRIQVDRLRQRLRAFAEVQARLRTQGWVIVDTERSFGDGYVLDVPGQPDMPLNGRVDRIDRFGDTKRVRIIDYKTGENAASPHESHHGTKRAGDDLEWQDLQLPLYRHLWRQDEPDDEVELAYIVLPRKIEAIDLLPATWTDAHLESALETARTVVRDIRAGAFERNRDLVSPWDDFARICQTTVFRDVIEDEESDAEVES